MELSAHFGKEKEYFDNYKDEVNDIILEILRDACKQSASPTDLKSEDVSTNASQATVNTDEPQSTEASPKRAKVAQAEIMTRAEFMSKAPHIHVKMEKSMITLPPKVFSTSSCGWHASEKVKLEVDGKTVVCQVGINCTIIGSKQWK